LANRTDVGEVYEKEIYTVNRIRTLFRVVKNFLLELSTHTLTLSELSRRVKKCLDAIEEIKYILTMCVKVSGRVSAQHIQVIAKTLEHALSSLDAVEEALLRRDFRVAQSRVLDAETKVIEFLALAKIVGVSFLSELLTYKLEFKTPIATPLPSDVATLPIPAQQILTEIITRGEVTYDYLTHKFNLVTEGDKLMLKNILEDLVRRGYIKPVLKGGKVVYTPSEELIESIRSEMGI